VTECDHVDIGYSARADPISRLARYIPANHDYLQKVQSKFLPPKSYPCAAGLVGPIDQKRNASEITRRVFRRKTSRLRGLANQQVSFSCSSGGPRAHILDGLSSLQSCQVAKPTRLSGRCKTINSRPVRRD